MKLAWWKLQRELLRVTNQMIEPYRQIRDALLRLDYRRRHERLVKHYIGDAPWSVRVAVFLIYQPQGIADSVVATCEHLRQQGYACVLVSNGKLAQKDINRILSHVARVIVRPNFGYDFGGYQEAMLWLRQVDMQPEQLLLLNDSVWFPAIKNCTFLSNMENARADVVGALSAQRGRLQHRQRKLFYASFMLLFSAKAWRSSEFESFWENYRQTSSKSKTIRRGERELSALFIHDARFTHRAMVDQHSYQRLMEECCATTWPLLAQELTVMDLSLELERTELLQCRDDDVVIRWRHWFGRVCDTQNMFACAQIPLILRARVPFIKKSNEHHNMVALQKNLGVLRTSGHIEPLILQEIQAHVNAHFSNSMLTPIQY